MFHSHKLLFGVILVRDSFSELERRKDGILITYYTFVSVAVVNGLEVQILRTMCNKMDSNCINGTQDCS